MVNAVNNGAGAGVSRAEQVAGTGGASTAAVSAGVSGGAAYLSALLSATTPVADAGRSGLRSPVNPENGEALLLLVESQSDQAGAATRGASLASRFGAAHNIMSNASAALETASRGVAAASTKLADSRAKLTADTSAGAGSDALKADQAQVDTDMANLTAVQTALQTLILTSDPLAAVSLIAKGLRADVAQDATRATAHSARRDVAYEDVIGTAKRFRDDEVDRARRDGPGRVPNGADRASGADLAAAYAAGMIDAMATLRNLVASPPPAVPQTAALEAGGRVRLSL